MKHKLFLCILILVLVGLYCENCVESFTQKEKDKIKEVCQTMLTNQVKSINVGDSKMKLNAIKEELKKELIDSGKCVGPQGPKGDTGGKANVYQGMYTRDSNSNILKLSFPPKDLNEQVGTNNIIKLKPTKDSPLNLELGERWQRTENDTLVYGDNPNFVMCYNKDKKKIGLCHSINLKPKEDNTNFTFLKKSQQIKVNTESDSDICLDSDNNELIAKKCDEKSITQQFFLH
jgi:hypothetical protein